jgi:hypothetical protein
MECNNLAEVFSSISSNFGMNLRIVSSTLPTRQIIDHVAGLQLGLTVLSSPLLMRPHLTPTVYSSGSRPHEFTYIQAISKGAISSDPRPRCYREVTTSFKLILRVNFQLVCSQETLSK